MGATRDYIIEGVDRESGLDTQLAIHAMSPENAKVKAELKGIVVTRIKTLPLSASSAPGSIPSTPGRDPEQAALERRRLVVVGVAMAIVVIGLVGLVGLAAHNTPSPSGDSSDWPNGFSPWDGSHIELVRYVKRQMHNPRTFEHVETKFGDNGGQYVIVMTYRGSNAFGAIITNKVAAKASHQGWLLEVNGQKP